LNKIKIMVVYAVLISSVTIYAPPVNAFFGSAAQIPYLIKLVVQAVKQYQQLRLLLRQAKNTEDLLKNVNSGLDDALSLLESLPIKDENILGELKSFRRAISEVENIYGVIPETQDANMFTLHDQTVAESLKIVNVLKAYANKQEKSAELISNRVDSASPKGAARINAQTNAAVLHTLNQILRINGQLLKLHSEQFAMANKGGKESAYHYKKVNSDIGMSLRGFKGEFKTPKFKD